MVLVFLPRKKSNKSNRVNYTDFICRDSCVLFFWGLMNKLNRFGENIQCPIDVALFVVLVFVFTLSLVQLIVAIEGDSYREQTILNIFWIISVMAIIFISHLKMHLAITRIKKIVQQSLTTTNPSSYIRQGDDGE